MPVDHGRYDVDLQRRVLRPAAKGLANCRRAVYWEEPERRCIRSSWFQGTEMISSILKLWEVRLVARGLPMRKRMERCRELGESIASCARAWRKPISDCESERRRRRCWSR